MARTFEIGLTMAGAISAGAYTAGVMDFFIEALDAYWAAKARPDWDGPTHDVRVPIMAGASAGGMTSAICALHAFRDGFDHVWPQKGKNSPQRRRNRLYSSWVEDIDIRPLLATTDIDGAGEKDPVRSLLCCDVIDRIVEDAFDLDGDIRAKAWIGRGEDKSLRLRLTLTNLRGVPYSFEIYGADDPRRYGMINHGDYLDFKVGVTPTRTDGAYALDVAHTNSPDWDLYRTAAKATGAFPIGLAPRRLKRRPSEYKFASRVGYDGPQGYRVIAPDKWIDDIDPYEFVSVDGGTIDNEPLEMTRRYLSGGADKRNPNDGVNTDKAVILIAPFPNYLQAAAEKLNDNGGSSNADLGLVRISGALLSTLIDQARFKPDELMRASDDGYFSRYLVAPTREDIGTTESKLYPIACGVMNGFGGFLHRSFRRHDYLLGRRNAQAFLRWHFNLPENAELFADFKGDREKWFIRKAGGGYKTLAAGGQSGLRALPIIPLTDALQDEIVIGADDLPAPQALFAPVAREELRRLIGTRAKKVVGRLVDVDLPFGDSVIGWAERWGAKRVGAGFAFKKATDLVDQAVDDVRKAFYKAPGP